MKTTFKTFAIVALMLSLSSAYAQLNSPINTSRSNIRTNRTDAAAKQTAAKPEVIETEEGWDFVNVTLSAEEIERLISTLYSKKAGPSKFDQAMKLLESGNFFVSKESLDESQKKVFNVLKTKHDTAKNSIGNIR